MESNLSQLSSRVEDEYPSYILPHYKESYRLAIYALLCGGREAYDDFLRTEQISHFLSDDEILFLLENAELPLVDDEREGVRAKDSLAPSTYFPLESDEEVPDLELGWPDVSLGTRDTSVSLLFNPPRLNTPSIKEVVRKQIQEARQVSSACQVTVPCTSTCTGPAASTQTHDQSCASEGVNRAHMSRAARQV